MGTRTLTPNMGSNYRGSHSVRHKHKQHSHRPLQNRHPGNWIRTFLCACALATTQTPAIAAQTSETESTNTELETITITGERTTGLTSPSLDEARNQTTQVPGATSLIKAKQYKTGRLGGIEDVLAFTPGVFVQGDGSGSARISIRGSGLSQWRGIRGIRFLRNGLPLNDADGSFSAYQLTPLNARYVQVYRGASALRYGAATLGGAINFVTHTGYTAAPLRIRLSGGSHGTRRVRISGGRVFGSHWDAYAAASVKNRDGFRRHSQSDRWQVYANLGYRHSPNAETRLHISILHNQMNWPGDLTLSQVKNEPSQARTLPCSPRAPVCINSIFNDLGITKDIYRLAVQHAIDTANGKLKFGTFYQYDTFDHSNPGVVIAESGHNFGLNMRHVFEFSLAGHTSHFVWGGGIVYGMHEGHIYEQAGHGTKGKLLRVSDQQAATVNLFFQNRWHWRPNLTLITGTQLAWAYRKDAYTFSTRPRKDLSETYVGFSPTVGLLWQATPAIQVFGNISRSFEPPTLTQFRGIGGKALDAQRATTIELGARARGGQLSWQIAVYHTHLSNEILVRKLPKQLWTRHGGMFSTANVDSSVHSGVEIGFDLRQNLGQIPGALHWRAAYTYSHFTFDDHPTFGDNTLPGIPQHFGRISLIYKHPSGFYIGPRLEMAGSYYVDYANTLKAPSYAIWGLRAGYQSGRFTIFIDAHNLGDEHYVATSEAIPNAAARSGPARVFSPGRSRAVYAGLIMKWE